MLVELTEKDIDSMDYPLRDSVMSDVLEKIEAGGAAVIGVDFYRDLPEPRDGSEIATLNHTLTQYPNIICIFLYHSPDHPFAIPPPPILRGNDAQYTFNNFPDSRIIRRAYLQLPGPEDARHNRAYYQSLPWLLAQYYLYLHNVPFTLDGQGFLLGKTRIPQLKADDGGYINDPPLGYAFLQDYRGPPAQDSIDTLSVSAVRALKDPSIFKDKIVLLGIAAGSSNDTFNTPISALHPDVPHKKKTILLSSDENESRVPGVFIHAQIVNQLLRIAIDGDKPTGSRSQAFGWIWLAVCCVCGAGAGFYIRSYIAFTIAILGGLGLIALFAWLQFLAGYWIITFGPATVFLGTAILAKGLRRHARGQATGQPDEALLPARLA